MAANGAKRHTGGRIGGRPLKALVERYSQMLAQLQRHRSAIQLDPAVSPEIRDELTKRVDALTLSLRKFVESLPETEARNGGSHTAAE